MQRMHFFFGELDRSGLPGLFGHLLSGNFMVGRSERVVRRFDPRFQMGFVQLHDDYQFGVCSKEGLRSKKSFTVWTPLQDCIDDDISRLLLLKRGETDRDLTTKAERFEAQETHYLKREPEKVARFMERVLGERTCYAPRIRLGSALIFAHDVVHGTFHKTSNTRQRFSMDFRAVAEYRPTSENAFISGLLYRKDEFPPAKKAPIWRRLFP